VSDEGSTNGTLVNGEIVERRRIGVGDEILVGNVRILLEEGEGDLPESLAEDWERFQRALRGRSAEALDALRTLASAEDCRMDPDGVVAINWAEGERGIDGLGPVRARFVEDALGILAGARRHPAQDSF
jgi:pSer/pThr/pTyr-binding forkhead associated (FHA) protein